MSCQCSSILGTCNSCQMQALQNQNNQSWQNYIPHQYQGIASAAAIRFNSTLNKMSQTLDQAIDETLDNCITSAQLKMIKAYTDLVADAAKSANLTREDFIKLKFMENHSEAQIEEIIKDKLSRIIKLKGML